MQVIKDQLSGFLVTVGHVTAHLILGLQQREPLYGMNNVKFDWTEEMGSTADCALNNTCLHNTTFLLNFTI